MPQEQITVDVNARTINLHRLLSALLESRRSPESKRSVNARPSADNGSLSSLSSSIHKSSSGLWLCLAPRRNRATLSRCHSDVRDCPGLRALPPCPQRPARQGRPGRCLLTSLSRRLLLLRRLGRVVIVTAVREAHRAVVSILRQRFAQPLVFFLLNKNENFINKNGNLLRKSSYISKVVAISRANNTLFLTSF